MNLLHTSVVHQQPPYSRHNPVLLDAGAALCYENTLTTENFAKKKKKKIKSASDKKVKSNPTHYKIELKFFCENIYLYIP